MNLLQMSVSGAVMIIVIVVIRALLLHKLPKRAFPVLWGVVLVRLLIPYTLPCAISAYSLLSGIGAPEISAPPADNPTLPPVTDFTPGNAPLEPDLSPDSTTPAPDISPENGLPFDIGTAVWIAGMAVCAVLFVISYIKCRVRFRESLPVESSYIAQWLAEHRRRISVRRSDRIAAPLTYGILRPVILLPKNYEKIDPDDLRFVLTHEYVHIRRFDAVFKLMLVVALCVHWFNPLVWVMYVIANKDIEISCDETVIRMLGEREKQNYAQTLIRMEEIKSGLSPLISHYSKNYIKERIVTIMKFKKTTALAAAATAFLVVGITTAFATSAKSPDKAPDSTGDTVSTPDNNSASANNEAPDASTGTSNNSETTLPETVTPPAEAKISVEDWLKQPHTSPLANVTGDFDVNGKYTFIPANKDSEVFAADDGEVVFADHDTTVGYGKTIVIKHDPDIYTLYAHLEFNHGINVSVGDTVKEGQCIGYVGISGYTPEYGLGFKCTDKMPDLRDRKITTPLSIPQGLVNYDNMIPVESGFICGNGVIPDIEKYEMKKNTIDYYLEKYADYVTLTPPEVICMLLPDYGENGKLVLYYIPIECMSEDEFLSKPDNPTS